MMTSVLQVEGVLSFVKLSRRKTSFHARFNVYTVYLSMVCIVRTDVKGLTENYMGMH